MYDMELSGNRVLTIHCSCTRAALRVRVRQGPLQSENQSHVLKDGSEITVRSSHNISCFCSS
jgi:hypothetical protein